MRKLTLKEMQAVVRGSAPAGGACDRYGCTTPVPPTPTPGCKPKPKYPYC